MSEDINAKKVGGNGILKKILTGIAVGFANGIFGGGGGMILVPMLTEYLGMEEKCAHATAILIILPLSVVSGLLYAVFGCFDVKFGFYVALGVTVGGALGALLLKRLSLKYVKAVFYALMFFAGIRMAFF